MYCARLGKKVKYRLALTGTPMANGPLDLYAQYRTIDPTVFGTSFYAFRNRYAQMDSRFPSAVAKDGNGKPIYLREDEMHQKFFSIAYEVTKDVLDLPPVQHVDRTFTLSKEAIVLYEALVNDMVASVNAESRVIADNILVQMLKEAQITSGYVRTEGDELVQVDTGKQELLGEVLDDLAKDEPVVVFARFHWDLDAIKKETEKSGRRYAELSGRRGYGKTLEQWQAGEADVIGVQLQAGGAGIDLTRARYCIYYSLSYSLTDYDQSMSRVHRPGQTRETIYIHLIAQGTIDEAVYEALEMKQDIVQAILGRVREEGE
jgi:SNF2 family DNA or RNA helicase